MGLMLAQPTPSQSYFYANLCHPKYIYYNGFKYRAHQSPKPARPTSQQSSTNSIYAVAAEVWQVCHLKQANICIQSYRLTLQMTTIPSQKQQPASPPPPNIDGEILKLYYFDFRGTCQPIIHLLYHLNVPFQMIYVDKTPENISDVGFNIGIPCIQDGEVRLHETIAIMHYLCTKYEQYTMTGLTPQSIARNQQLLMKYFAQRKRINALILQAICMLPIKPDKYLFVESFLKKMCLECKYIDYCLRRLAKGKSFLLDELSIVDFLFYETCFYVSGFFGKYISNNTLYRFFKEFRNRFQSLSFFAKKRKEIEQVALFMAFNDEVVNTAIEETWEGGPYKLLNRS